MKKTRYYFELAARLYVFLLLNTYGLGKIAGGQFYRKGELPLEVARTSLSEASSFDLAWTFMGHSYAYILFIGISQVIGAWCLLWERTKFIGITILIPIMLNIIVFDIIFLDTYGALASAVIYFVLLITILALNKIIVIEVFNKITKYVNPIGLHSREKIKTGGIVVLIMMIMFGIEQTLVTLIGH